MSTHRTIGIPREVLEAAKPLAVPVKTACKLLGVGNTTMWALIKDGRVKTTRIGRRRLVIYASLETLLILEAGAAS
jgi:excisionase family DNA binding protein